MTTLSFKPFLPCPPSPSPGIAAALADPSFYLPSKERGKIKEKERLEMKRKGKAASLAQLLREAATVDTLKWPCKQFAFAFCKWLFLLCVSW